MLSFDITHDWVIIEEQGKYLLGFVSESDQQALLEAGGFMYVGAEVKVLPLSTSTSSTTSKTKGTTIEYEDDDDYEYTKRSMTQSQLTDTSQKTNKNAVLLQQALRWPTCWGDHHRR